MWVSVFNVNLGEYARAIGLPSLYIPEGQANEDDVELAAATGHDVQLADHGQYDGWSHDAQPRTTYEEEFPSLTEWPGSDEINRLIQGL